MLIDIKLRILKFIDHWVGGPICIFLCFIQRLTHIVNPVYLTVPLSKPPRSILVIKFFGLGSIILSSSLLKAIREKYPDTRVIFLTFENNAAFIRGLGLCHEIRTIGTRNPARLISSISANLVRFSFDRPDISIDLEFYSKFSTIMSYLSGARWRVGFFIARFWRSNLVNVPIYFNYARHILQIYSMAGEAVGVTVEDPVFSPIPVIRENEDYVDDFLKKRGIVVGDMLIGVNVNASTLALCRRWPLERFAETINSLLEKHNHLKVILTGSKDEQAYTSSILGLLREDVMSRVFNAAGVFDLGAFLALLKRLNLFLTCDSGPLHLAKTQGVPTLSIWGPGSPDLYGPYGEECRRHRVIYKRWECSPCMYIYRTDAGYFCRRQTPCLDSINSREVVEAVEDCLHLKV